jgi:sugar phosphate isomerase/epimerase
MIEGGTAMRSISRRELFRRKARGLAAAGLAWAATRNLSARPLGLPIGSQTYPHRQRIRERDFAGLCRDLAALGVEDLELCSPGYPDFADLADAKRTREIIEDHGLRCSSAHVTMEELRTRHAQILAWAHEIGMRQLGAPTLGGPVKDRVTTMDAVKRAAEEYNRIAEATAKAGLEQILHNEGFELSTVDGRLTYEALLELLDPKLVKMQFQMSAMRVVGDPVIYFTKYPGRFTSMHLQGVDLNAPPPAPGTRRPAVAVGKDSLDWRKIFTAARTGGLKNYYVELSWDLTVESVAFLKSLEV